MSLQMVDLQAQVASIRGELDGAVAAVLESGAYVRGPFVERFENELATYLGGRHAIGVASGTDALQIAYMALGVGPGDEVITPAFTFIATAEAAALLGATPVFVDIDPRTFNLDPEAVEAAISERTKTIVPVHLYGQPADMEAVLAVADRHGIPVVEDAAQCIGARYGNRVTGYLGALGCLSFYPSKNLGAFGDGGAVLTDDDTLAERVRTIANHGGRRKYHNEILGVNSRLDAIQAAMLSVKLRHLHTWTAARQAAAAAYDAAFAGTEVITPHRAPGRSHVFHQYTIRVPAEQRDGLQAHLQARGVPTMIYYPVPLHRLEVYAGLAYADDSLPETERAAREVISLPMHPHLTLEQIHMVATTVLSYLEAPVPV
jgi:UDP-2-acetamido-2-deoxy-ribo-hexuluronate aminotransferase